MNETEAVLWCPHCKRDRWRVDRVPTGAEGVCEHKLMPIGHGGGDHKTCPDCGGNLARRG